MIESELLRYGKRPPRSARQHLAGPVEFRPASAPPVERELAAIFAADIAGYSRLMGA